MNKEIHFLADYWSFSVNGYKVAVTHSEFQGEFSSDIPIIYTTSLVDMSFDLVDKGYRIYLHENQKVLELFDGLEIPGTGKQLRKAHNLIKLWKGKAFWGYFYDDRENSDININMIGSIKWKD